MIQILSLAQKNILCMWVSWFNQHIYILIPLYTSSSLLDGKYTLLCTSRCHISHAMLTSCGRAALNMSKVDTQSLSESNKYLFSFYFWTFNQFFIMHVLGQILFYPKQVCTNYTSNSGECLIPLCLHSVSTWSSCQSGLNLESEWQHK